MSDGRSYDSWNQYPPPTDPTRQAPQYQPFACGAATVGISKIHDSSSTPGSVANTQAVALIAPGDGPGLAAHLAKPPTGAKILPIDNSTGGVQTLDQYIKNSYPDSTKEKGILQSRGFAVAAENDWRGTDGVQVDTQLLQFGTADGAQSHIDGQHAALVADKTVTKTYTLPRPDAGYGYERSGLDKVGDRQAIFMCQMGPIVIVMTIYTPGQFDVLAEEAILQFQVAALAP